MQEHLNGFIINFLRRDPLLLGMVFNAFLLSPKHVPQIGVSDMKRSEHLRQARFIAPGCSAAVRDTADVDDVIDVVRLDQRNEPHETEVAVPNCINCFWHT